MIKHLEKSSRSILATSKPDKLGISISRKIISNSYFLCLVNNRLPFEAVEISKSDVYFRIQLSTIWLKAFRKTIPCASKCVLFSDEQQ